MLKNSFIFVIILLSIGCSHMQMTEESTANAQLDKADIAIFTEAPKTDEAVGSWPNVVNFAKKGAKFLGKKGASWFVRRSIWKAYGDKKYGKDNYAKPFGWTWFGPVPYAR